MVEPSKRREPPEPPRRGNARPAAPSPAHQNLARQGWAGVAFWMTLGFLLEALLAYKTPAYLNDPQRRELFRLAHAHGTLLSLLLVVAAIWTSGAGRTPVRAVSLALRLGALLVPLGFLLAGIWHFEGDPGYAIWLVPLGALAVIFGVIGLALNAGPEKGS